MREFRPDWKEPNKSNGFSNSGLAKNITRKNTKSGHSTVEANYNAEKNSLSALKKKHLQSLFTPVWMQLYDEISKSDPRFQEDTDQSEKVLAHLRSILKSIARIKSKKLETMPISNKQKEIKMKTFLDNFYIRTRTGLTYDKVLEHMLSEQKPSANLTRLSGTKKLRNNNGGITNSRNTKKQEMNNKL